MLVNLPIENFVKFSGHRPAFALVSDINPVNTSLFEISTSFEENDNQISIQRIDTAGRIVYSYALKVASSTSLSDGILVRSISADTYLLLNLERTKTNTTGDAKLKTISLIKVTNKEIMWIKSIDEMFISGRALTTTRDGGVVLVGCKTSITGCGPSFVTKFDSTGSIVWHKETNTVHLRSVYESSGGIVHVTGAVSNANPAGLFATQSIWIGLDTTAGDTNFAVKANRIISAVQVPGNSDRIYWLKVETQVSGLYTFLQYRISSQTILSGIQWLSSNNKGSNCLLYDYDAVLCTMKEEDALAYERYSLSQRQRTASVRIPLHQSDTGLDASSLWYSASNESVLVYPSFRAKAGKGVAVFRWADAQLAANDNDTCYIKNSKAPHVAMQEMDLELSAFRVATDTTFAFESTDVLEYIALNPAEFASIGEISSTVTTNDLNCALITSAQSSGCLYNPLYWLLVIPLVFLCAVCAIWCGWLTFKTYGSVSTCCTDYCCYRCKKDAESAQEKARSVRYPAEGDHEIDIADDDPNEYDLVGTGAGGVTEDTAAGAITSASGSAPVSVPDSASPSVAGLEGTNSVSATSLTAATTHGYWAVGGHTSSALQEEAQRQQWEMEHQAVELALQVDSCYSGYRSEWDAAEQRRSQLGEVDLERAESVFSQERQQFAGNRRLHEISL